jgi:hypothetical protein
LVSRNAFCYFKQLEIGVTTISAVAELRAGMASWAADTLVPTGDCALFTSLPGAGPVLAALQLLTLLN